MKSRHCCALFAWTLLPLAAFAQSARPIQSTYAPADAHAPVAAASYTSVLAQYQAAAEQAQAPDQLWRAVNKEVEGAGGGMAHMGHTGGAMAPAAGPAKSQPQPPAADPLQGHQMHHQHKGD